MNEKIREFIQERGWILGRLPWRSVTHVFRNGKSLCGAWKGLLGVNQPIHGTENPMCKRCMRSLENEYNKS